MGVLYILDEPPIGLHQRDNHKLLNTLKNLRDLGNTVIVVEHDEDTMRDGGFPGGHRPGGRGPRGQVVFAGPPEEIKSCEASLTGQYLSGRRKVEVPENAARATASFRDPGCPAEQPEKRRREHSAGDVCLCHRGVRVGKILPHQRDPL